MLVPVQPHVPAMHVLGASLAAWELTHVSRGRRSNVGTRTMVHSCVITDVGLLLVLRAGPVAVRAGPHVVAPGEHSPSPALPAWFLILRDLTHVHHAYFIWVVDVLGVVVADVRKMSERFITQITLVGAAFICARCMYIPGSSSPPSAAMSSRSAPYPAKE